MRAEILSQTEVLNSVSLLEKELRCLSSSGWRGWSGLSRIDSSLFGVLLSTAASMVSGLQLATEPAFLVGFAGSDASSPAVHSREQCTGNNRLVENIQHFAAHTRKDLSFLTRQSPLIPFLCTPLALVFQFSLLLICTPRDL